MYKSVLRRVTFATLGILLSGCHGQPTGPASAELFLRWSMDRYKAMSAFRANCSCTISIVGIPKSSRSVRTILYQHPNQFRIVTAFANGLHTAVVSDGKTMVEYSNQGATRSASFRAPKTIDRAGIFYMKSSFGTLLYPFFEGSVDFDDVADLSKGHVWFVGDEESRAGERARTIEFYGRWSYGHVKALIGEQTGFVYRLEYDSKPIVQFSNRLAGDHTRGPKRPTANRMASSESAQHPITSVDTVETYTEVQSPAQIAQQEFDPTIPKKSRRKQDPPSPA